MAQMKHIGRVKNTGRKCVVVFREIYDDRGHVIDSDNCLVFETESLPDAEHQDLMRILESKTAQTTGEIYNVLSRERLGTGQIALTWLAQSNRLRKFPTSNVILTPDAHTQIGLDTINRIVQMQKTGASEDDINRVLQDDTDLPPRQAQAAKDTLTDTPSDEATNNSVNAQTGENLLDDAAIAKGRIEQAEMFEKQATELREQAYSLDPSLKPKRRTRKKTTPAKQ